MNTALDHSLFQFINQGMANPILNLLCPLARNKFTWLPLYIIASIYILYKYKTNGLWILAFAGLTILLSDQLSNLIKLFIHRLRPCVTESSIRLLVERCSDTYSFTSNHAANHFAIAIFLSLVLKQHKWLLPSLLLWASFIAFSQVYVGLHYPADVAGGAAVGLAVGFISYKLYQRLVV